MVLNKFSLLKIEPELGDVYQVDIGPNAWQVTLRKIFKFKSVCGFIWDQNLLESTLQNDQ